MQSQPAPPTLKTSFKIGSYIANKIPIGEGSFATVYIGHNEKDENKTHPFAIKKFKPERLKDAQILANLNTEIEIMRKLRHANAVQCYDVVVSKSKTYAVLEYCAGGDLEKFIKARRQAKSKIDEKLALHFVVQIAKGLKYLSDNFNVIHRDLKPQNLMLDRSPEADPFQCVLKLCDFGFARSIESHNMAGTVCGTPLYMAPEIMCSSPQYDSRADLWSVGCILWELLTLEPPFNGNSQYDLIQRIKTTDAKALLANCADAKNWSKPMRDLIRQLLKQDPSQRITQENFFCHECISVGYKINILPASTPSSTYSFPSSNSSAAGATPAVLPEQDNRIFRNFDFMCMADALNGGVVGNNDDNNNPTPTTPNNNNNNKENTENSKPRTPFPAGYNVVFIQDQNKISKQREQSIINNNNKNAKDNDEVIDDDFVIVERTPPCWKQTSPSTPDNTNTNATQSNANNMTSLTQSSLDFLQKNYKGGGNASSSNTNANANNNSLAIPPVYLTAHEKQRMNNPSTKYCQAADYIMEGCRVIIMHAGVKAANDAKLDALGLFKFCLDSMKVFIDLVKQSCKAAQLQMAAAATSVHKSDFEEMQNKLKILQSLFQSYLSEMVDLQKQYSASKPQLVILNKSRRLSNGTVDDPNGNGNNSTMKSSDIVVSCLPDSFVFSAEQAVYEYGLELARQAAEAEKKKGDDILSSYNAAFSIFKLLELVLVEGGDANLKKALNTANLNNNTINVNAITNYNTILATNPTLLDLMILRSYQSHIAKRIALQSVFV